MSVDGNWYAENLRATFFVTPQWQQRALFRDVTGQEASELLVRPQLASHQEVGPAAGAYLTISQNPGRIDIVLSDTPSVGMPQKSFFWAGQLDEVLVAFERIVESAVALVNHVTRIAYAVTALQEAATPSEVMHLLKAKLPNVDFDPTRDLDLVFQLNRRRNHADQIINRLARWEFMQSMIFRLDAPTAVPVNFPAYAARVYVDASTAAEATAPMAQEEVHSLMQELSKDALQIVKHGASHEE